MEGHWMTEKLVVLSLLLVAVSGIPGLCFARGSLAGQRLATSITIWGAGLGLVGLAVFWFAGDSQAIVLPWMPGADFHVAIDGLSAFFLLPILLIALLGSIYGMGYWKQTEHPENGRKLRLFYGVMTAGMMLLVIARNSIVFLFGWEIMALAAYFLITTEDNENAVREAGWLYLVATHIATLSLFALFALLRTINGSFALVPLNQDSLTPGMATAILILA